MHHIVHFEITFFSKPLDTCFFRKSRAKDLRLVLVLKMKNRRKLGLPIHGEKYNFGWFLYMSIQHKFYLAEILFKMLRREVKQLVT